MGQGAKPLLLDLPEVLETPRLLLRATRAGMGPAVHEAAAESFEALKPWMPWATSPQTLEQVEEHCREMQAKWHAREMIDFCFHRRGDEAFVGKGGLHTIDWEIPKLEIGYWIRSGCAGKGYCTEAAIALAQFARDELGARRLEITSDARNAPSRRVAEKAGFVLEGILRQARRDNGGELADHCMYARIF